MYSRFIKVSHCITIFLLINSPSDILIYFSVFLPCPFFCLSPLSIIARMIFIYMSSCAVFFQPNLLFKHSFKNVTVQRLLILAPLRLKRDVLYTHIYGMMRKRTNAKTHFEKTCFIYETKILQLCVRSARKIEGNRGF